MHLRLSVAFRSWVSAKMVRARTSALGAALRPGAAAQADYQRSTSLVAAERRGLTQTAGAIYVEFLIAFLPVFTMFLGLMQLAFLFSVRIAVEHAALNAARTAAVVIGDDEKRYNGESRDQVRRGGQRYAAIRRSAILSLAPFILDDTLSLVEISFPPNDIPGGDAKDEGQYKALKMNDAVDKVRVRIEARAACKIMIANRIICGEWWQNVQTFGKPAKLIHAEAMYPYQGARYDYP